MFDFKSRLLDAQGSAIKEHLRRWLITVDSNGDYDDASFIELLQSALLISEQ
jgi:hypothetical protein